MAISHVHARRSRISAKVGKGIFLTASSCALILGSSTAEAVAYEGDDERTVGESAARIQFDIPAQPLEAALTIFARQAGIQLLVNEDLRNFKSNPLVGLFHRDDAARTLLRSLPLTEKWVGDTLVIRRSRPCFSLRERPSSRNRSQIQILPLN